MNLSIIVTAHNEGLIAHKTILSIFEALKMVPKISYEIIVHLDYCDEATRKYFLRYKDDKRFRILENSFGDLGLSRNYAIKQARGKYIQIIDADDIIASHHIEQAFNETKKHHDDDALYYPEFVYYFGDEYKVKVQRSVECKEDCAKFLLADNIWCSMVFGKRKIFLESPYHPTENGYGHEDWIFNTETSEKNILHRILPQIALFYRRDGFSLCSRNISNNVLQPESPLFDFSFFKTLSFTSDEAPRKPFKDTLLSFYKSLRNKKALNFLITPLATIGKRVSGIKLIHEQSDTYIKEILLDDIRKACELENLILPKAGTLDHVSFFDPTKLNIVAERFFKIANTLADKKIDYIFLVPNIDTGGASRVTLNYLNAIHQLHPSKNVLIISTSKSTNSWANKVPKNTIFINFEQASAGLSPNHIDMLLARIILQTKCKRIHIINSLVGYNWIHRHSSLINTNHYNVTASFFAREISGNYNGALRHCDYADPYIMRIDNQLSAIFTDNSKIRPYLINQCGIREEKIFIHYQPCTARRRSSNLSSAAKKPQNNEIFKILWASRVCPEKNPELLLRIANGIRPEKCEIHVFGKICQPFNKSIFKKYKNVSYHGEYDEIDSIDPSNYDCFLYTSKADGLPNVLLEVAQYNIPIIASCIGGIGDFIVNNNTGLLVDDINNEKEYIDRINLLRDDKNLSESLAENARKLVKQRHSEESFAKTIDESF